MAEPNVTNSTDDTDVLLTYQGGDVTPGLVMSLVVLCFLSVWITVSNWMVFAAFYQSKVLRILCNYYVISLAASDIIIGLLSIPLWMYFQIQETLGNFEVFKSSLYQFYIILDILSATASIVNLTAISLDRYLAVTSLSTYRRYVNLRRVLIVIALVWVYSAFVSLLKLANIPHYVVLVSCMSFFIPLLFILFSYGKIFRLVRYRAKWTGSIIMEIKQAKTLLIVIGGFLLCWGPFFIVNLVSAFCPKCPVIRDENQSYILVTVVKWLQYVSSGLNPVIYAARNREFRFMFHKMIFRCPSRNGKYIVNKKSSPLLTRLFNLINSSCNDRVFRKKRGRQKVEGYRRRSSDIKTTTL